VNETGNGEGTMTDLWTGSEEKIGQEILIDIMKEKKEGIQAMMAVKLGTMSKRRSGKRVTNISAGVMMNLIRL